MATFLETNPAAWLARSAPGITRGAIPANIVRNVKAALRAVDRDIERTGTVTAETVDLVRLVLSTLPK